MKVRVALLAGLLGAGALAQHQATAAKPEPRVLVFGDTTLQNLFGRAENALKGRAKVVRSPLGYLDTGAALTRLDEVLGREAGGKGRWDLVCFNFGRGDMMYRDPSTKAIRVLSKAAGGVQVQPVADYEEHLVTWVRKVRATGAKVAWISTMPLRPGSASGALHAESVSVYNAAALRVMTEHGVPVVDLHAEIQAELAKVKNPRGIGRRYNDLMKGDLSGSLVARVEATLGLPAKKSPGKTPK